MKPSDFLTPEEHAKIKHVWELFNTNHENTSVYDLEPKIPDAVAPIYREENTEKALDLSQ